MNKQHTGHFLILIDWFLLLIIDWWYGGRLLFLCRNCSLFMLVCFASQPRHFHSGYIRILLVQKASQLNNIGHGKRICCHLSGTTLWGTGILAHIAWYRSVVHVQNTSLDRNFHMLGKLIVLDKLVWFDVCSSIWLHSLRRTYLLAICSRISIHHQDPHSTLPHWRSMAAYS